jgi:hypothetical protein
MNDKFYHDVEGVGHLSRGTNQNFTPQLTPAKGRKLPPLWKDMIGEKAARKVNPFLPSGCLLNPMVNVP